MERPELIDLLTERRRKLTVGEYHRMIDAAVFDEDGHLELLHGILVAGSPQGGTHARIIQRLTGMLVRGVGAGFDVRVQLPLTLTDDSEPEPDFAVVPRGEGGEGSGHPAHALLVVEISASSLRLDRAVKAPLYARAGIPELWLVDVHGRRVEVMRDPDPAGGNYRSLRTVEADGDLAPSHLPGPALRGADLLP